MRTPKLPIRHSRLALASIVACFALTSLASAVPTFADGYDPGADPYSMYSITSQSGIRAWWAAGYTGKGVDVAVIDTGVSRVGGLDGLVPSGKDKVAYGPDLSFESQAPNLRNKDTNGHGTFMAGLIAGNDNSAAGARPGPSVYRGMAPDARIVSIKVGAADGGVDASQVIAAINWVVQHKQDSGFKIRVISLSYGTSSMQDPSVDPLAAAVETAWKAGIVVVAAAGNRGYLRDAGVTCLADPANDPYVIAVAGADTNGTDGTGDDTIGGYSSTGAYGCKNPDFAAPGSHIQGLRVPNSYVDQTHPEGYLSDRYFRGTGTSQATAITAGAIAVILQKYSSLTPDKVKRFFQVGADTLPNDNTQAQGAGEIDLTAMAPMVPPSYSQRFTSATGKGTLEGARGGNHVTIGGTDLQGEQDIMGKPWVDATMGSLIVKKSSWSRYGVFNTSTWSGTAWTGTTYNSGTWTGATWDGRTWTNVNFSINNWDGGSWTGNSWTDPDFGGHSWTAGDWADDVWATKSWQ